MAEVRRCALHMLQVASPEGRTIDPAILSGYSMLRYPGFAVSPALPTVRRRLAEADPSGTAAGLNLMLTQRPNGDLIVGDTHTYTDPVSPFQDENLNELILRRACALLGVEQLAVRARWQGVYASAPQPFLVHTPAPAVRLVSVTSGIGMTTAFGLGASVVGELVTPGPAHRAGPSRTPDPQAIPL